MGQASSGISPLLAQTVDRCNIRVTHLRQDKKKERQLYQRRQNPQQTELMWSDLRKKKKVRT